MPGGFERFSCTLERDPRLNYPDLAPLSTITVYGVGGDVAWQGRLEKIPDVAGSQAQVTPEAVGWQAHLEDDNTAREIYIDQELSKWEGPTIKRQIALVEQGWKVEPIGVGADPETGRPSIITSFTGPWTSPGRPASEAWYDAHGIPLGSVWLKWSRNPNINGSDTNWNWDIRFSTTDNFASFDEYALRGEESESPALEKSATVANRTWVNLILDYAISAGSNIVYAIYWGPVAVFGRHGLTKLAAKEGEPGGFLASDVVAHAISRWAPKLTFSTGIEGTIRTSAFVIPQLSFPEPTMAAEMLKQATRFELQDWAVWEGPTFYMNPRGEVGKAWRARVGPAKLEEAGPQVARMWNGVCVQYQDVTGITRMVGPPGFAGGTTATEDSGLLDSNPENPVNELGIKRYALLKMGTSTIEGAKAVGRKFLEEQSQLETSGQATITGHVEGEGGVVYPAWAIRAGDTISFVDASDSSPRRIIKASYDESTRACQVQLDQPPDAMQALLERLSVVLTPLGL
jgi:hypothetical protein